jgi:N-acyl-D-amino-acid deacylase
MASLACISACSREQAATCRNNPPGFLISNVQIVDGSGARAFAADARINDGLIADIGELAACDGETVVDGDGRTLAPGFIDSHSHADGRIEEARDALAAVSQGITTVVIGQDGSSQFPLADFFARLEKSPATVNFASYVGHNRIRTEVMGDDNQRVATKAEIDAMAELLTAEMRSGALGLSTGLEYEPGIYAETAEVIALAKVTAAAGGRYISHLRSEDRWLEDAIDEIILIGRETGMPVQISHIKLAMTPLWGTAAAILQKLDAARDGGVRISADIYPYEYWQSTMMVLLPERDYTDRAAVAEALDTIAPAAGIWLTLFEPEPEYVGKPITEIADILETDPVTAFMTLAKMADEWESPDGGRAEMIIGTSMHGDDIRTLLAWPHTNICSDGGLGDRHPRGAGAFPRVLGRYVREETLLSLPEAVHKMTGLTAAHLGFTDRGIIRQGAVADLVLFDPDTVIDHATPEDPGALSSGISRVWVGGELVYADGATTGARPGKIIRRLL